MRNHRLNYMFFLMVMVWTSLSSAARWDPGQIWATIQTDRFYIHYPDKAGPLVPEIFHYANAAYDSLARYYDYQPDPLHVVVNSEYETANGYFAPFPDRVYLYLTPPLDEEFTTYSRNWLEYLIFHELAHHFHLNKTGGFSTQLKAIFGEWVMPGALVPYHVVEGLATDAETRFTSGGRGRNAAFRMRWAAPLLSGEPWAYDQIGYPGQIHQPADRAYLGGYFWTEFLAREINPDVPREIIDRQLEKPYRGYDHAVRHVTGNAADVWYQRLQQDWHSRLRESARIPGPNYRRASYQFSEDTRLSRPIWLDAQTMIVYTTSYADRPGIVNLNLAKDSLNIIDRLQLSSRRSFDISANGRLLLYASNETDRFFPTRRMSRLYQHELASGQRRLIPESEHCDQPRLSPDNRQLVATRKAGQFNNL